MPKLIRDGYINTIPAERLDIKNKSNEEKLELILDKFKEEAMEFIASNQRDPYELADLMQVVIDWGVMNGLSEETLQHVRKKKELTHGGFKKFIVLLDEEEAIEKEL